MKRKLLVLTVISWFYNASTFAQTVKTPQCGDFLATLKLKPEHLVFEKCEAGKQAQIRVLSAEYQVKGRHAKSVEQFLVEKTDMGRLVFACCGWESAKFETRISYNKRNKKQESLIRLSGDGFIENSENPKLPYFVRMTSGETLEKNWDNIDYFYVTVELPLELP